MSTRANIAIRDGDKLRYIYSHSDGYPEYVGAILYECYTAKTKVQRLIGLGDISVLKERVTPKKGETHSFSHIERAEGVTVAYRRDRGETGTNAQTILEREYWDNMQGWTGIEYVYVYDLAKGIWETYHTVDGIQRLNPNYPELVQAARRNGWIQGRGRSTKKRK